VGNLVHLSQALTLSWDDCRLLLDSFEDCAIAMLEPEGLVATWNEGAKKLMGYTADDIIGRHFSAFYTAEDAALDKPERELAMAREIGKTVHEGFRVRKDGRRVWAQVTTTALRDAAGRLHGYAQVTRDITEKHKVDEERRRTAEEELRRSQERLRLLVESVSDYAIFMVDVAGHVTTWNKGAEKNLGYSADEVLGKHFSAFFPEESLQNASPERELTLARLHGRFEEEDWRVRKDGSRFWANVTTTAIHDSAGELVGFAKVTRDLTVRVEGERMARELVREQAARAAAEAAEVRLKESELRYRALSQRLSVILEGVADGISVQDRSGRVVFVNTAAARSSGFESAEAFVNMPPGEVLNHFEISDEHGVLLDHAELPGRRVLAGEPFASRLLRVRHKHSGRTRWSMVQAAPVFDANDEPELAVNIWHDVTEQRRAEEHDRYLTRAAAALAETLDYGRMLATLASVLVPGLSDWCAIHMLEDDELRQVTVAHVDPEKVRYAEEFGRRYPPSAAQSRGVWKVLRSGEPELYPHVSDELVRLAARDPEHLRMLREAGMKSAMIVPISLHERALGTISLVSASEGRSYDERDLSLAMELGKRAGQALENARLFAAERRARADVALLAEAGEVFAGAVSYEQMLEKIAQIARPTLGDFAFFDLVEGAMVRRTARALDPKVEAIIKPTEWVRSDRKDLNLCALSSGESALHSHIDDAWIERVAEGPEHASLLRLLELSSMVTVPLRSRGALLGSLTLCFGSSRRHHTVHDLELAEELARRAAISITQVRLFAEAREAARRAEEANRVKDEFLATVSHELRTPLNAILGWASVICSRSGDPQSVIKASEVIHRNALAQSKIVDDILDVSRIVSGKLRLDMNLVDLGTVIRDAVEVVRPAALGKGLTISLRVPGPCLLLGDRDRLQQVVWNLLSNAVKFSHPGGSIEVSLTEHGKTVDVAVADSGRGIDPLFLPHVFDRFKQEDSSTTRRVGGLGLGLAIVRHLVELHGGSVFVESDGLGAGATFVITLPVRTDAPTQPEHASPASLSPSAGAQETGALVGVRVLVVDDEADARELLQTVLHDEGAIVETASSAAEGLAALPRFLPHVLVSDIGMPEEDGYAFLRKVRKLERERGGNAPAVALTAYTRDVDRIAALDAGFTNHLGKPIDPRALIAVVASLANLARS
jgi:PAS domain S-box-containing protein